MIDDQEHHQYHPINPYSEKIMEIVSDTSTT
jgi:hypothetical protein